jgi:anti-anti-sigma factor
MLSAGGGAGSPPGDGRLRIELEGRSPAEAMLRLVGELDLVTTQQLRDELARHRAHGVRVVLDLSAVEFLDSTGLVLLMDLARERTNDGWSIALRRDVSPAVARVIEVTKSEQLFDWVDAP